MAIDVLGCRVHDDVGMEIERSLQDRREKGVVDHCQRTDRMRRFDNVADIDNAQQWIRRRLDPHQPGLFGERGGQGQGIVEIDEGHAIKTTTGLRVEQAPGSAVAIVRGNQQIAGFEQGGDQGDRGHAGCRDHGAGSAFEIGQGAGQRVAGRIARTRVIVATFLVEAGKAEIGRQDQWRHHRAKARITIDAGAHGTGGGTGAAHALISVARLASRMAAIAPSSLMKASWP
jgi:hypothetical protein